MANWTDEALLLAVETREDLFGCIEEMAESKNNLKVLVEYNDGLSQNEIAERAGINQSTVSRGIRELEEVGLLAPKDDGYEKQPKIIDHPIINHLIYKEVIDDVE